MIHARVSGMLLAVSLACLTLVGCAGHTPATVDPRRPANSSLALDRLVAQTLASPLVPRAPGFAALTIAGELVFLDTTGQVQFHAASAASHLHVCGDAIGEVAPVSLQLRAWPAGDVLGSLPREEGFRLVGAAVEGTQLAVIEASGPRRARISVGSWDARGARYSRSRPADGSLGAPLLRAGLLLIPHDGHELLLLDANDGAELARRRSHDDTIRWARLDQGRVYFGGRRAYPLRTGLATMSAADAVLDPDLALVPAPPIDAQLDPAFADEFVPGTIDAGPRFEATRPAPVHWSRVPLEPSDAPQADRAYVITRGHVFAFDGTGMLRFVHTLLAPPLATLATSDGLLLLHADGLLHHLHPDDGAPQVTSALPPLRAAQAVPGTGADLRSVEARTLPDAATSLLRVLRAHDTRTVPDQVYAAHLLSATPGSVGAELLALYLDPRTEPPVRDAIAMTLRARASDTETLVGALGRHYDFLGDDGEQPPPPLQAIVPALARAERSDAYAALLQHLDDPATPLDALPLVVDQLVRWGGAEALGPLLAFLRRYRADTTFAADVSALAHAARAVDALGGERERAALVDLLARSGTHAALIESVAEAARARENSLPLNPTEPLTPSTAGDADVDDRSLPRLASTESVTSHALDQMEQLSPCLEAVRAQQPSLRTVRVRLLLERGGRVSLVSVLPGGELERCIADAAMSMRWPRIRSARQQVGFSLRLAPDAAPARLRSAPPFWAASSARAPRGVAVQPGLPWWSSPEPSRPETESDAREWWQPEATTSPGARLDRWWLPTNDETPADP